MWDTTSFTKNRDRLSAGDITSRFLARLAQDKVKRPLSGELLRLTGRCWRRGQAPSASGQRMARARHPGGWCTARHPGDAILPRIRKRIAETFGSAKATAGLRKTRHRGLPQVDGQFTLAMAAYDLVRLPKRFAEAASRRPPSHHRRA